MAGLGWPEALLIGAILAPTDPVFAAALVGNDKVPARLRHLLNVESGVNDGLALPFVVVLLAVAAGSDDLHLGKLGIELAVGLAIGVLVPLAGDRCWSGPAVFAASAAYAPLNGVAIGLLVLALGKVTHGNLFLAAFAAGITVATFGPRQRAAFEHFGENIAELFKLAALLVFGALISVQFLGEISWTGWVFAVLAIFVARPVALWISFLRSGLGAAGAGRGDVVRAEGLRLGRLRAAGPGVRHRRRRRGVPPRRPDHRDLDPAALLDRRGGRAGVRRGAGDARLVRRATPGPAAIAALAARSGQLVR